MPSFVDLTGQKFGKLFVLNRVPNKNKRVAWSCLCDCGSKKVILSGGLKFGLTRSCGCYHKDIVKTHGHCVNGKSSSMYESWQGLIQRCFNPKDKRYKHYGGRGITVCDRWLNSFTNFISDVGERPLGPTRFTLDRKNNDGNYCPDNCRWATDYEQRHNRQDAKCSN